MKKHITKQEALKFLLDNGYAVEIKNGIVTVYEAEYKAIKSLLKKNGYDASFGVEWRTHVEECI